MNKKYVAEASSDGEGGIWMIYESGVDGLNLKIKLQRLNINGQYMVNMEFVNIDALEELNSKITDFIRKVKEKSSKSSARKITTK